MTLALASAGAGRQSFDHVAISPRRRHVHPEAPAIVARAPVPCSEIAMTFVVTEPCVGCKYTDCVVVCPAECFHEGEQMLFIDPHECLDCEACVPECPVSAIFHDTAVPSQWQHY